MYKRNFFLISLLITTLMGISYQSFNNDVKVIQIGVIVSDLEASYKFYTEIIGMEEMGKFNMSSEMAEKYEINSGKEFDIIDLKLECDGYFIQYKLNKTKDNLPATFSNEKEYYGFEKIGSNYFSIGVKEIAPYIKRLDENNIEYKLLVISEWDNYKVILVHDPDGVLLEIGGR